MHAIKRYVSQLCLDVIHLLLHRTCIPWPIVIIYYFRVLHSGLEGLVSSSSSEATPRYQA